MSPCKAPQLLSSASDPKRKSNVISSSVDRLASMHPDIDS